jgi:hypothetical protein
MGVNPPQNTVAREEGSIQIGATVEQAVDRRDGKADDVRPRALDPFDESRGAALNRVRPGFPFRLARGDVPIDFRVRQRQKPNARRDELGPLTGSEAKDDPRVNLVLPAGQKTEHPDRFMPVMRLPEDVAGSHHDRIGGKDELIRRMNVRGYLVCLLSRDPERVSTRILRRLRRFIDVRGKYVEGKACRRQELRAARGSRRQDDAH